MSETFTLLGAMDCFLVESILLKLGLEMSGFLGTLFVCLTGWRGSFFAMEL